MYQEKFHGMLLVSDFSYFDVRNKSVIEFNSNNKLICTEYGNFDEYAGSENLNLVDLVTQSNPTESNITGALKRYLWNLGYRNIIISETAAKYIKKYARNS